MSPETKIDIDFKNKKQYLIGVGIALILSLCLAVIPVLFGTSLVGQHTDFSWSSLLFNLFFYMLIIGPVEELIFRVYLQETFIGFFYKNNWMGVIIASFMFLGTLVFRDTYSKQVDNKLKT